MVMTSVVFTRLLQRPRVAQGLITGRVLTPSLGLASSPLLHRLPGRALSVSSNASAECYTERLAGDDTGIAVLTLDRPKAKNAISRALLDAFRSQIEELRYDTDVRVVVLRSNVEGVFCAGADLKERATMTPDEVTKFLSTLRRTFRDLETLPMPTIAALDGAALGGGLEMALCCDFRVAGPRAVIGLPETRLAIIPGGGGTQRLTRLIGIDKAKELIYTGATLKSEEAKAYGVITRVALEDAYSDALKFAREILPQGPIAIRMAKLAIDRGGPLDLDAGLEFEQACYAQVIPTEDRLEGLRAFREKRKPVYRGK